MAGVHPRHLRGTDFGVVRSAVPDILEEGRVLAGPWRTDANWGLTATQSSGDDRQRLFLR
jgi:hypothetical protein